MMKSSKSALDMLVQCALTMSSDDLDMPTTAAETFYPSSSVHKSASQSQEFPDNFGIKKCEAGQSPRKHALPATNGLAEDANGRVSLFAAAQVSHIEVVSASDIEVHPLLKGSSRHSPYGMRFLAQMRDGSYKTSHISGDLLDRVRIKQPGKGSLRGGLSLTPHVGEMMQLEKAAAYYRDQVRHHACTPTATQVCEFLKTMTLDKDYRKNTVLSRRNAGNFYKRLMYYLRTNQPNHKEGRQAFVSLINSQTSAEDAEDEDMVDVNLSAPASPEKLNKFASLESLLKLSSSLSVDTLVDGDSSQTLIHDCVSHAT